MHIQRRKVVRLASLAVLLIGLTTAVSAFGGGPIQEEDATILLTFAGENVGDAFGWVGENLGDINGDSINDTIITAPFHSAPGTTSSGKIYVYSGSDGTELNAFAGNDFEQLGFSATTAGDVNNDGVPDYIAGGTGTPTAPQPFTGRAVVFSGADHAILYDIPGTPGDRFGSSVSAAGDLNDDDFDDFLVAANRASYSAPLAGRVYAFSGQDGSILWTQDGLGAGYLLGTAAGKVGDVTDDGVPDVVVGAVGAPIAGTGGGGRAFVYSGSDGSLVHTLLPKPTAGVFGLFFASGAGDVNSDGYPDIFVADFADRGGNPPTDPNGFVTGQAYLFSGEDSSIMRVFKAHSPAEGLGPGRGIGQDVNGDGYNDFVIAGYTNSDLAPSSGRVYVISGRNGRVLRTYTGTIANDWLGSDAFAMGDVNGDGVVDYMLTAYGLAFAGSGAGTAYLVAGTP